MRRFTLVSVFALVAALILSAGFAQSIEELTNPAAGDWPTYGRDLEMTRYSPLDQINSDNVANLRLAWTVDADYEGAAGFSPAVYNGVMYINGPDRVVAMRREPTATRSGPTLLNSTRTPASLKTGLAVA